MGTWRSHTKPPTPAQLQEALQEAGRRDALAAYQCSVVARARRVELRAHCAGYFLERAIPCNHCTSLCSTAWYTLSATPFPVLFGRPGSGARGTASTVSAVGVVSCDACASHLI